MEKAPSIRGPLSARDIESARMPCYIGHEYLNNTDISFPDVCELCLDDMDSASMFRQLPCGHVFHKPCVEVWLVSRDASCPLCRRTFYHLRGLKLPQTRMKDCGERGLHRAGGARAWLIPRWIRKGLHSE